MTPTQRIVPTVCPERLVAARYQIIDLATNEAGALVPKVACEKWGGTQQDFCCF